MSKNEYKFKSLAVENIKKECGPNENKICIISVVKDDEVAAK